MQAHKKLEIVKKISSEEALRIDLIIPLFRKMGFDVLDNQAHDEFGTDVILIEKTKIGADEHTAIILKKGDIDGKAGSPNSVMRTLFDQSTQACKLPLSHPSLKNVYPNKVWVVTNGKITRNAQKILNLFAKEQSVTMANYHHISGADLVGYIDEYWPEYYLDSRPFLSQYQDILKKELFDLNVSDLGESNRSVEGVFIPQVLTKEKGNKPNFKKIPLTPMQLMETKSSFVSVSGEAGSGKSTLLKRLAIDIIDKSKLTPVCISATNLSKTDFSINEIVERSIGLNDKDLDQAKSEFLDAKLVLLVDAIDEVKDSGGRQNVLARLQEMLSDKHNPIHRVIVTTRPETSKDNLKAIGMYSSFQLMPVAKQHVLVFFKKWFGTNNNPKLKKLFRELKSKSILEKMPKTPMTLTLLAILYESKGDIPSTLTELYRMFTDLLLGKWDIKKGINNVQTSQIRFGVLSYIAWQMHQSATIEVKQEQFVSWTKIFLVERLGDSKTDASKLVQDIIDRSGLISVSESSIKFKHFSFQEFFCSQEIYSKKVFTTNLVNWVEDDWWSEVLFFSAGSLRSLDDHFDTLSSYDFDDKFLSRVTIGNMLQAAYETSIKNKSKLISDVKNDLGPIIEEFHQQVESMMEKPIPNFVPYAFVMEWISDSYTSKFMEASLESSLNFEETEKNALLGNIFVAMALAKSGNLGAIEELATTPGINDPIALLLIDMALDEYNSRFVGSGKSPAIHKSIKKKISKNIPAIRALLKPPPK